MVGLLFYLLHINVTTVVGVAFGCQAGTECAMEGYSTQLQNWNLTKGYNLLSYSGEQNNSGKTGKKIGLSTLFF